MTSIAYKLDRKENNRFNGHMAHKRHRPWRDLLIICWCRCSSAYFVLLINGSPEVFSCKNVEFFPTILGTSQADRAPLQTAFDVSRERIMWKRHRCEVQTVRRRNFSVVFQLSWTIFHFQHLKRKTKQMTVLMNVRCDAVIGGIFPFFCNCGQKVISKDACCVPDSSHSGRVTLNHCYLVQ